jgi:hypothetical protein
VVASRPRAWIGSRPPRVFWIYLGSEVFLLGLIEVVPAFHAWIAWSWVPIESLLLFALFAGSAVARRGLIFLGVISALGGIAIQSTPLDTLPTLLSALQLLQTALLLTPAMRRHTNSSKQPPLAGVPQPS